jgi:hypothetical protein
MTAISLVSCAWINPPTLPAPIAPQTKESPPPLQLTAEAAASLAQARQRVAAARVARTLWTSAVEKLAAAERAAVLFDSAATMQLSAEVIAICEKSQAQASSPAVTW